MADMFKELDRRFSEWDDGMAERRARAKARAAQLEPGDYYASDRFLMVRSPAGSVLGTVAIECETHWDACLVMIAKGNENAPHN